MSVKVDIDPVLNYLGPRGRFQLWQMMLISMGGMCAHNQLYDIIFIGQDVPYRCASPNLSSDGLPDLPDVTATSEVSFEGCNIVVKNNVSDVDSRTTYDCVFGYEYDRDIDASFMSEFGLVCDRYLLVGLSQTILVLGQGLGAFGSSIISDRFGRKPILVGSQLGLLIGGVAIGASPSYPALVIFKFLVGACQQGVVAGISTLGIELFPQQHRSLSALIISVWWAAGGYTMALFAYLLRHHSWRVLQYSLSSLSLLMVLLQLFLIEESLRWLVANGRKEKVLRVLKRAALTNRRNVGEVLATLHRCQQQSAGIHGNDVLSSVENLQPKTHSEVRLVIEERSGQAEGGDKTESASQDLADDTAGKSQPASDVRQRENDITKEDHDLTRDQEEMREEDLGSTKDHVGRKELTVFPSQESDERNGTTPRPAPGQNSSEVTGLNVQTVEDDSAGDKGLRAGGGEAENGGEEELSLEATRQLTLLDMFRHRTLRFNALLTFFAWFTVAFVVFTLYLMSTSYAGDPYVNFLLAALMEAPPAFILYFGVDRLGRKLTVQGLFGLAGVGCMVSAICLMFPDNATLAHMSAVFAMAGMLGGSGAFSGLFFYTPEYFPTNMRNQALGTGSTVGRIGGMIAPFMKNLSMVVMWGPGVITGSLCMLVVFCVHFLPETRGKQLPTDIEDIDAWYSQEKQSRKGSKEVA